MEFWTGIVRLKMHHVDHTTTSATKVYDFFFLFFGYFGLFNQTVQCLQQIYVHSVFRAGIRTHSLQIMSLLLWTLNQCSKRFLNLILSILCKVIGRRFNPPFLFPIPPTPLRLDSSASLCSKLASLWVFENCKFVSIRASAKKAAAGKRQFFEKENETEFAWSSRFGLSIGDINAQDVYSFVLLLVGKWCCGTISQSIHTKHLPLLSCQLSLYWQVSSALGACVKRHIGYSVTHYMPKL